MDKGKKKVEEWVENNSQDGVSGEESDSPYFDDIMSPGGQHINFGTFENLEIKKLWSFQIQDNATAVINEYGSNFLKSKFDPLAAIEAKKALLSGKNPSIQITSDMKGSLDQQAEQEDGQKCTNAEVQVFGMEQLSIPSPYNGTQEAPEIFSSQEEHVHHKRVQLNYRKKLQLQRSSFMHHQNGLRKRKMW